MPNYRKHSENLEIAAARFSDLLAGLHHAVTTGLDSYESAAKVAVLATQVARVSSDFYEALTVVHCDNLSIEGETPCENSDDFAAWAKLAAHDRSYAPFEGVRSVRTTIDLQPFVGV